MQSFWYRQPTTYTTVPASSLFRNAHDPAPSTSGSLVVLSYCDDERGHAGASEDFTHEEQRGVAGSITGASLCHRHVDRRRPSRGTLRRCNEEARRLVADGTIGERRGQVPSRNGASISFWCSGRGRVQDGKCDSGRRYPNVARCRDPSDGSPNYTQDGSTASEVSREEAFIAFRRSPCGYPSPTALTNDSMQAVASADAMLRDPLDAHLAHVWRCRLPNTVPYYPPTRTYEDRDNDQDAVNR